MNTYTPNTKMITAEHDGQRFERWAKKSFPQLSYGMLQKLIRTGQFRVDGKRCKSDTTLTEGQEVRCPPSLVDPANFAKHQAKKKEALSEDDITFIKQMVIYEDQDVIAFNKPHGLAVQGGTKTKRHIDGLLDAFINKETSIKPRLLHRIDKDTSGLLLCGKTNEYTKHAAQCFKQKSIKKAYIAICSPAPEDHSGTIFAPLAKIKISGQERMAIDEDNGDHAVTHYETLDHLGKDAALVCFMPVTGRTHQIRVHAQYGGFPILGDPKYNQVTSSDPNIFDDELRTKRDSITNMCTYQGLHLHAYSANIPPLNPKHSGHTFIAPISEQIRKSIQTLGLSVPNKDELLNLMDFTKT